MIYDPLELLGKGVDVNATVASSASDRSFDADLTYFLTSYSYEVSCSAAGELFDNSIFIGIIIAFAVLAVILAIGIVLYIKKYRNTNSKYEQLQMEISSGSN